MSTQEETIQKKKKGNKQKEKKRKKENGTYIDKKRIKNEKHEDDIIASSIKFYECKTTNTNNLISSLIPQKIPNLSRNLRTHLSIVIPSSIISIRSDIIKSYLTSHLARICTVFSIANVYIYDDEFRYENHNASNISYDEKQSMKYKNKRNTSDNKIHEYSYSCSYLHYNLQYLETPQYLRKHLFPISNFLKHAGIMNPLCAPHHLQSDEWLPFREGVVIKKTAQGLLVDVGLFTNALVTSEKDIPVGTRVTILFDEQASKIFELKNSNDVFKGRLISPDFIPETYNVYWGYKTEILKRVSDIFKIKSDYLIGTSERGKVLHSNDGKSLPLQQKKNILIVFGNKDGLEDLLIKEREEEKQKKYSSEKREKVLKKILKKFDLFINTCYCQTSRTIRTEEAITITMSLIHNMLI